MVQLLCTQVNKWENESVETIPRMRERGRLKRMIVGVNSSVLYLIYFKNFCKC
jgi:hypothetical protein